MLQDLLTIIRKEILEILNYRNTLVLSLGITLVLGIITPVRSLESLEMSFTGLNSQLDIYLSYFFLPTNLVMSWVLTTNKFLMEKIRGNIEALLSTPLSIHIIWLGKALSITLISFIPAMLCALITIGFISATQESTQAILPSSTGWLIFVLTPFVNFGIITLSGLLQLVLSDPGIIRFAPFGFIVFMYRIGLYLSSDLGTSLILGYIFTLILLIISISITLQFLTKERIVLQIY